MAKVCGSCGRILHWPAIYSCYYCQKVYCDKHRLAENHECPKVTAAKHIEKDWLRKKGINITSGSNPLPVNNVATPLIIPRWLST